MRAARTSSPVVIAGLLPACFTAARREGGYRARAGQARRGRRGEVRSDIAVLVPAVHAETHAVAVVSLRHLGMAS